MQRQRLSKATMAVTPIRLIKSDDRFRLLTWGIGGPCHWATAQHAFRIQLVLELFGMVLRIDWTLFFNV